MIFVLDIGNSDVTAGLWHEASWKQIWRLPTDTNLPQGFYVARLRDLFLEFGYKMDHLQAVVISSVVPEITDRIKQAIFQLSEKEPVVLGAALYKKLPIGILNPNQIGSDLVSNALAAYELFNSKCVVVDFGTALTFTTVSANGEIIGVSIVPGLKTAIKALTQNTAQLFEVPLVVPASVLGKDTTHAIQAGVLHGYEGLVRTMLQKIKTELNEPQLKVVATGGLSSILPALKDEFTIINRELTLDGLRLVLKYA
ncbi:type III pantothenate kinase [Chryseotalea sanaruensis]|uniref:Type III pantothenate kinase n=1 Tax=Chryseotalea sanaruensis TaxID=2482724 RepID=A0A401UDL3_9BACT|nr:type III pantothenate kinase [Chryseotalea sanaruensis]GCC52986.1 type III pantothenate kinase [Chryseotalea sanaruensis]